MVSQITQIERRVTRIHRIRARWKRNVNVNLSSNKQGADTEPPNMDLHYTVGKSENLSIHVPTFAAEMAMKDDPAAQVRLVFHSADILVNHVAQSFISKLKAHLWPRFRHRVKDELGIDLSLATSHIENPQEKLLLKKDRMYQHHTMHINFTTYDVRRAYDILHPRKGVFNIMGLAGSEDDGEDASQSSTSFWYARVLGIYHVNAVYIGPGAPDFQPRRFDFLWVRWYDFKLGSRYRLDTLRFPPMDSTEAFGFVDPKDVLRCCHLIPSFHDGLVHPNADALRTSRSQSAEDVHDYKVYYINRHVVWSQNR